MFYESDLAILWIEGATPAPGQGRKVQDPCGARSVRTALPSGADQSFGACGR